MIIPDLNIKLISSGCWLLVAGYWKFEKKVKKIRYYEKDYY